MSTLTWKPTAHDVRQIDLVTVAGTWAAADTVTLTINNKDLVVTIGAVGTSTANVALAIKEAWNANSRLDSEGSTDATSNFGGQEFGEYAEVTATIDPDSTSVVRLTANTPGKPFTLTVTEATVGDGTATESTETAATGKHFWNNADNWDTGAAPVDDDVVVFRDSDVSVKYGLPDGAALEATINQYQSFTGWIGLPAINRDNAAKPYPEYRQRYVRLDDGGTGTDIAHRFGIGQDGTGSPLINLKHITLKISPVVYNTGTPQIPGTKALNIIGTANTSTIHILNGSVDYGSQDGSTAAFVTVEQTGGDSAGINGIHTTGASVIIAGGTALIGGTGAIADIQLRGGSLRLENQTGTIASLELAAGTLDYASTGTITGLVISGGTFDARNGAGGFTVSSTDMFSGKLLDPYRRATFSTAINLNYDISSDLQLGARSGTPITIDN